MFEAQTLQGGTTVFSPWVEREGDSVRIALDLVSKAGNAQIAVTLHTKETDDAGDGNDSGGAGIAATGTVGQSIAAFSTAGPSPSVTLNDLVRYKFVVTGTSDAWVLFRMLPAVWFDSVEA